MPSRLMVTQTKSKISEKWNQRESLRSLGLKRIGDSVVRIDDRQTRGYLRAVAHLVKVEEIDNPLKAPMRATPHLQDRINPTNGSDVMSKLLDSVGTHDDGFQVLPSGDFLEWHKRGDDRSLIWSTALSADEMVRTLGESIARHASTTHLGVVVVDADRRRVPTQEVAEIALHQPARIAFLRMELASGASILWSRTSGNSFIQAETNYSEASVVFDAESADSAEAALSSTGTKQLGDLARSIVRLVVAA